MHAQNLHCLINRIKISYIFNLAYNVLRVWYIRNLLCNACFSCGETFCHDLHVSSNLLAYIYSSLSLNFSWIVSSDEYWFYIHCDWRIDYMIARTADRDGFSRYAKANRKIIQWHVREIANILVLSFVNKILQVCKRYSYRRDILSKSMPLTSIFAKYRLITPDYFAELSYGFLLVFTLSYIDTIRIHSKIYILTSGNIL